MANDDLTIAGLLDEAETALRQMISGVLRFTFEGLPKFVREIWAESFEELRAFLKFGVRLARVAFFAIVWAVLVFGFLGLKLASDVESSVLVVMAVIWAGVGIAGSAWGLNHIRVKRKSGKPAPQAVQSPPVEQWWQEQLRNSPGSKRLGK